MVLNTSKAVLERAQGSPKYIGLEMGKNLDPSLSLFTGTD